MVKFHYIVAYDVSQDDVRLSVANHCKNVGLERIQYSVFFGALSSSKFKDLKSMIDDAIVDSDAVVHYFPICKSCFNKIIIQTAESPSEEEKNEEENQPPTVNEILNFEKAVLIF